jgi:hypothetical protein
MDGESGDEDLTPILVRLLEGRVGSTMLMQLLGTSPMIDFDRVYPFENSYLTYLVRLAGQMAQPFSPAWRMVDLLYGDEPRLGPLPFDPVDIDPGELARQSLGGLWSAFSCTRRRASPGARSHYAEKYWGRMAPVERAGITAVVVYLVRDPRDVVASVRAFNVKRDARLFGRAQVGDDDEHLRRMVAGMGFRFREMEAPIKSPTVTLRYEDLVTDPADSTGRLEAVLGIPLDPSALTAASRDQTDHMTSRSAAASVGRWRQDLSDDEVALIERRLGAHMTRHGYALETPPS